MNPACKQPSLMPKTNLILLYRASRRRAATAGEQCSNGSSDGATIVPLDNFAEQHGVVSSRFQTLHEIFGRRRRCLRIVWLFGRCRSYLKEHVTTQLSELAGKKHGHPLKIDVHVECKYRKQKKRTIGGASTPQSIFLGRLVGCAMVAKEKTIFHG